MNSVYSFWKAFICIIGGGIGWLIAEFEPTFPLIIVAIIFIVYDAWTAYQLDKRVHKKYPEKSKREKAKSNIYYLRQGNKLLSISMPMQ